jgi:hypothetical protein
MDKEKYFSVRWIAPVLAGTIAVGCARCDLDQPHIHVETEPYENSVVTLSYTPTSNVFSQVVESIEINGDLKDL